MTDSADERPWKCEAQPLDAANPPHAGRRTALLYFMKHLHCRSYSLTLSLPLNRRYPRGSTVYSAASQLAVLIRIFPMLTRSGLPSMSHRFPRAPFSPAAADLGPVRW